jgi:hypothetical protein
MRMSEQALYELLPAIYRIRDAEEGYPLREFVGVLAEQAAVLEENVEQLYDDQFVETCADWVVPYLGELIGYRPLHGTSAAIASPRAEVANTIAYRQRLGTASVLEQLARDVTGWPARATEYFLLSATTQRMNHIRPQHHLAPDLRSALQLETLGTGFDPFTRLPDMRSIAIDRGLHNFPNVGIHLWRIQSFAREGVPATGLDALRFTFSPLGAPLPLFVNPRGEEQITHIAEPLDVAQPITRRMLHADLEGVDGAAPVRAIYGRDNVGMLQSLVVELDGVELVADEVHACNLSDDGAGGWAHMPAVGERIAIDPELGRVALPPDRAGDVRVSFHYGFPGPIGGGAYERAETFLAPTVERPLLRVPDDQPDIQSALEALPVGGGIVEISDNATYADDVTIAADGEAVIELRAANGSHPHLQLVNPLTVSAGFAPGNLRQARVIIDGLLISGAPVRVPDAAANGLESFAIRHCTLVPGIALDGEGAPVAPGAASVELLCADTRLEMEASITGRIAAARDTQTHVSDSIVDAAAADPILSPEGVAFAAAGGDDFGGALTLVATTVLGKVASEMLVLVSDSIVSARLADGDAWSAPIRAERRQQGCCRFSFIPRGSITPRRYRCQPQLAVDKAAAAAERASGTKLTAAEYDDLFERLAWRLVPSFAARRYGRPNYVLLRPAGPVEIRTGASDESEMGAWHLLYAPQREANLRIRLAEYLRFALAAGIIFEN